MLQKAVKFIKLIEIMKGNIEIKEIVLEGFGRGFFLKKGAH